MIQIFNICLKHVIAHVKLFWERSISLGSFPNVLGSENW